MLMTKDKPDASQMLSANQAGRLLGVSGKTLIRMMENGQIRGFKIGIGGVYKFRRGDIDQYLLDHEYKSK